MYLCIFFVSESYDVTNETDEEIKIERTDINYTKTENPIGDRNFERRVEELGVQGCSVICETDIKCEPKVQKSPVKIEFDNVGLQNEELIIKDEGDIDQDM